jgi:hypothetical protein
MGVLLLEAYENATGREVGRIEQAITQLHFVGV